MAKNKKVIKHNDLLENNTQIDETDETDDPSRDSIQIIRKELESRFKNLNDDVFTIDQKLNDIQKTLTELDTQITNIKNIINNETDGQRRGKLFGVLNECLELKAKYYDIFLKGSGIKYQYRKEEDDFTHKKLRLINIEIPKARSDESNKGFSIAELLESFKSLQSQLSSSPNDSSQMQVSEELFSDLDKDKYGI